LSWPSRISEILFSGFKGFGLFLFGIRVAIVEGLHTFQPNWDLSMQRNTDLSFIHLILALTLIGVAEMGCSDDSDSSAGHDSGIQDSASDLLKTNSALAHDLLKVDSDPGVDIAMSDVPRSPDGDHASDAGSGETDDTLATTQAIINFVFKNNGKQTVYLHQSCTIPFQVIQDIGGTVHENAFFCLCPCASSSCLGGIACGVCIDPSGLAVEAGKSVEKSWAAQFRSVQNKAGEKGNYECLAYEPIPIGRYHISVSVYSTSDDAAKKSNATVVSQSFELTSADATVEVPIQ
jgi:hypothetical protein